MKKKKKREYGREQYKNLPEDKKQGLLEYKKTPKYWTMNKYKVILDFFKVNIRYFYWANIKR